MRGRFVCFGHQRRMVVGNEPFFTVPTVGVRVAAAGGLAIFGEGEGVKTCVQGGVAADLDVALVNAALWLVFQEVNEVVFFLGGCQTGGVGQGGQQDGVGIVVGHDLGRFACSQ